MHAVIGLQRNIYKPKSVLSYYRRWHLHLDILEIQIEDWIVLFCFFLIISGLDCELSWQNGNNWTIDYFCTTQCWMLKLTCDKKIVAVQWFMCKFDLWKYNLWAWYWKLLNISCWKLLAYVIGCGLLKHWVLFIQLSLYKEVFESKIH